MKQNPKMNQNRETVETTGRSVEEAIEVGLIQLDASRNEVEVEILDLGKTGFLGFGSAEAKVRVSRLSENASNRKGKQILDNILKMLEVEADTTVISNRNNGPDSSLIEINGEDSGLLIGRHGTTLRSLQFIVNAIISRSEGDRILIDVEEYRQRRNRILENLATRVASRVANSGRPITLEPMPANERRIIHLTLANHGKVSTSSTGINQERKVVITPTSNQRSSGNQR